MLEWHGVHTTIQGTEFVGDCPFFDCQSFIEGKPEKFSMNRQTGQWQCFMCGKKGNDVVFLQDIHYNWLQQTTPAQLQKLRELRKFAIDMEELVEFQVVFNAVTKEFCLPSWSAEGKLTNLYLWRESFNQEKQLVERQIFSSPGMKQSIYGLHRIRAGTNRPIWVAEGHWDYLALHGLFRRLNLLQKYDLIGCPGAGLFPNIQLSVLGGRSVRLVFDNDKTGIESMDRLVDKLARNHVMSQEVQLIRWPEGLKTGFDVSDSITSLPSSLWPRKMKK